MRGDIYQCRWLVGDISCGKSFVGFNELIAHLGRGHDLQGSASRTFVCQWSTHGGSCGGKYRRYAFGRHITTHLNNSHRCTVCGKSFHGVDSLRAHLTKKHGDSMVISNSKPEAKPSQMVAGPSTAPAVIWPEAKSSKSKTLWSSKT